MKIRSGFVSNSSSSSFICNVCGNVESGYDVGLSDVGMFQCENGHTCCEDHKLETKELTLEEKRQLLVNRLKTYSWIKPEEISSQTKEIQDYDEDEIEEQYQDYRLDRGDDICSCPVCQFEKLNSKDGFLYLLKKFNLKNEDILKELKEKFPTYSDFKKDIS